MKCEFIKHITKDGGVYFTSPSLSVPHRFTTRTGKPEKAPVFAKQIHSDTVLYVTEDGDYCGDGFITDRPGLFIAVKTADCTPILMYDKNAGVIAAVHAGWRGTIKEIAVKAFEKLKELGAAAESIKVAIGPSVCFDCYEVQQDFYKAVSAALGPEICDMFVRISEKDGKLHAAVADLNAYLLRSAGILDKNICECGLCTCCEPALFYSYRRERTKTSQWNIISLPEN